MTARSRLTPLMRQYLAAVEDAGLLAQGSRYRSTRTIRALESLGLVTVDQHGPEWSPGPWRAQITQAGTDMLVAIDAGGPAAPSVYRCADCGHGRRLFAWAYATVYGPLGSDGELSSHDWVDACGGLAEDSIQCGRHPGGVIEMCIDSAWCRWWSCPRCRGKGYTEYGRYPTYQYRCQAPTVNGKHECWRTLEGDWWDAYRAELIASVLAPGGT